MCLFLPLIASLPAQIAAAGYDLRVVFSGPSILSGLAQLVARGVATAPLPAFLTDAASRASNDIALRDADVPEPAPAPQQPQRTRQPQPKQQTAQRARAKLSAATLQRRRPWLRRRPSRGGHCIARHNAGTPGVRASRRRVCRSGARHADSCCACGPCRRAVLHARPQRAHRKRANRPVANRVFLLFQRFVCRFISIVCECVYFCFLAYRTVME